MSQSVWDKSEHAQNVRVRVIFTYGVEIYKAHKKYGPMSFVSMVHAASRYPYVILELEVDSRNFSSASLYKALLLSSFSLNIHLCTL